MLRFLPTICRVPRMFSTAVATTSSLGSELIPLVNKLQKVTATLEQDLDLPQLVVVGGQSSGKSSVLESLVGRDFLPRGTGIVTRRPLVLQLSRNEEDDAEYGEFAHAPGTFFSSFSDIRDEISAETDRLSGSNKGISPVPIILQITSPHVIPLTLVDTPGMARVPVGDQPRDIEDQVRNLVYNYISKPGAIILAVQPANQDLATSDALKLARDVDPAGHRTIGVLTKLDLMDAGTDALDILTGRVLPLKLGIVGVVNRSQADVASNRSVEYGIDAESKFFATHPVYKSIADSCGSQFLAKKASGLLAKHIRRTIPKLHSEINSMHASTMTELEGYGSAPFRGAEGKRVFILQILNKIAKAYADEVEGHGPVVNTDELNGGARIRYIFQSVLADALDDVSVQLSTSDIRTAIKNAAGTAPALFVPEAAFEVLIRSQIARLRDPLFHAADLVHNELLRALSSVSVPELERFAPLKDATQEVGSDLLRSCMKPTRKMLANLVDCELAYINTNHPDFTRGPDVLSEHGDEYHDDDFASSSSSSSSYSSSSSSSSSSSDSSSPGSFLWSLFSSSPSSSSSSSSSSPSQSSAEGRTPPAVLRVDGKLTRIESMQVRLIVRLLESYLEIVKKQLADMGAKAITHFLLSNSIDNLEPALVANLYKEDRTDALLQENPAVMKRRADLEHRLQVLEEANEVLQLASVHHLEADNDDVADYARRTNSRSRGFRSSFRDEDDFTPRPRSRYS